jgi:glc operon protein GlcG
LSITTRQPSKETFNRNITTKTCPTSKGNEIVSTPSPQLPAYGLAISLEHAKVISAAAQAEAVRKGWCMVVAIMDSGGHLVLLERMDNAQFGSVQVAQDKARSAVAFRRPTKAFHDMVAAGGEGVRMLGMSGAVPIDGGLPIIVEGVIVGGIGISGGTSAQDGLVAQAGLAVLVS